MRSALIKFANAIIDILVRNGFCAFRPMRIDRIGHLAGEVDLWLKERALQGKRGKAFALIACGDSAANFHLLTYFKEYFHFLIRPSTWDRIALKVSPFPMNRFVIERPDYFVAMKETASCFSIYTAWGDRPPLFQLRQDDRDFLQSVLRDWGLPEDSWFVCLHNRERGYSPSDDYMHIYRNASIDSYSLAIQEITKRGGWVIRMGDPNMTPLPSLPQVIDYAHSPLRSPRLDVCLCASSRFFLATSSGLYILGTLFGVPVATVNSAPMSTPPLTSIDIAIPKLYVSACGRRLSFPEVMTSPLGNYRFNEEYEKAGIRAVSNSPEDIRDLTVEMLERLDGTCNYTEEDEDLQHRFRALFQPGHYGYGCSRRFGKSFLRAYRDLLPERLGDGVIAVSESPTA
jgi:putative glycosyltransferase (TIGR04372 family)